MEEDGLDRGPGRNGSLAAVSHFTNLSTSSENSSDTGMLLRSRRHKGEKPNDTGYLEGKDWISNLPDAILCHVLSFMLTRDAVRTSVLSTRWKSLWASVPIIDFSMCWELCGEEDGPGQFMDFVDRVFLLHDSPNLNKFLLSCEWGTKNTCRLNSWISAAIKRHVQELHLSIRMESIVEVLKLDCPRFCWSSLMVFLPRLKVLHLHYLNSLDDASLKNLLSGCPVLEELEIFSSKRDEINTLCICSSTLKKLVVRSLNVRERSGKCVMVIKAPSLESLDLSDGLSRDFEPKVDELPALVEANFGFWSHAGDKNSDYNSNAVVRMLEKASNVRNLYLRHRTLEIVIRASAYNQLLFSSLTHLNICFEISCSDVLDLLGHTPSLRVLHLKKVIRPCAPCLWGGAPENVPICLSLNLEKINFFGFSGCDKEMKLVRYLLENAMVLKKLTLRSWSRNKKIKSGLRQYRRGSSTCQIELH